MADFNPFPVPETGDDTPLVQGRGSIYICTGCGDEVPQGSWLFEAVEEGMVVGITATNGVPLIDAVHDNREGRVVHQCGQPAEVT